MDVELELPRGAVKRIVKQRLDALAGTRPGGGGAATISREALAAFCEAGRIFVHFLSAGAGEACADARRQTVGAGDVLAALEG